LAVGVYEGESDLLGLAVFRGLAKGHPLAGSAGAARLAAWAGWRSGAGRRGRSPEDGRILDRQLRAHAREARWRLARVALEIDRAIRRHGRGLGERQLLIGDLSAQVRELVSGLAVAHHADVRSDDESIAAADVWCRLALARAAGRRPTPADLAAVAALGRRALG
ncbi:MAG: Acyl-CoA dehydrogenase, partial [Planctomycetota bacterium]